LAEDVRYYGRWMRDEAQKRIGYLYPKVKVTAEMARERPDLKEYVGEELTVIAWLWARTVASPNPVCKGAHVPLVRSFSLATKPGKRAWIQPRVDENRVAYSFEIRTGAGQPPEGTVGAAGDRCLITGSPLTRAYIRGEAMQGRLGVRLMAIVGQGERGRVYLAPAAEQEQMALSTEGPVGVAVTDIVGDTRYLTPTSYGMTKHRDLFTGRQLTALSTFSDLVPEARRRVLVDCEGDQHYADAVATYLALATSKLADGNSVICSWMPGVKYEVVRTTFSRQALPMTWDYAEANPFAGSSGDFEEQVSRAVKVLQTSLPFDPPGASARQLDAAFVEAPRGSDAVFSTDPPYYDNVPYADLSDFFYIWLRRCLREVYPDLFSTVLVPKDQELVADAFRQGSQQKARDFFERGIRDVFEHIQRSSDARFPATVYYAFRQTEEEKAVQHHHGGSERVSTGWDTMLQGLLDTAWRIQGTWPMRTERDARSRGIGSNALASSIVLVCRPRPANAPLATRKEFLTALRQELPAALRNLQQGNIAPVDLAQAAIGPGMAVFTRYAKVMETDDSPMTVRTALALINQALDEVLAEQEGEFDGDTRWALAWFEQFGMDEGPYGVAETLSKAKNTAVGGLVEAGVVRARGGKVRLVKRDELPDDWDPARAGRLTVWEAAQHLIRTLDRQGEPAAAALLHQLGGLAETARDLAYRLYTVCERKKWAEEALAYNGLVIAWPELTRLAVRRAAGTTSEQPEMFS
jgi:putative DNA methylase